MPLRNASDVLNLYTAQLINAAGEASTAIDVSNYTEVVIYIRTTAKAGTTPAVVLDAEVSGDNLNFHTHTANILTITDPTVPVDHAAILLTNIGKWLRIRNPLIPSGSGSPSLTVTATMIGKN